MSGSIAGPEGVPASRREQGPILFKFATARKVGGTESVSQCRKYSLSPDYRSI